MASLDPNTALVVIDLQKGVVGMQTVPPAADVVTRSAALARAFRARNLPVVLVNASGRAPGRVDRTRTFTLPPGWDELVPELDARPTDHLVTKFNIGAFYGTALEMNLRRAGATQIVVTGIATGSGVESTVRAGFDHGFNVVTVIDAMSDADPDVHRFCIDKVFPRFSETATTAEIIDLLARSSEPAR